MSSRSVHFAEAGRLIAAATRRAGFTAPTFRSPPRSRGRDRALRRRADGSVTVAVRIAERPFVAVIADMVDGTVAANQLLGVDADTLRNDLWVAVQDSAVQNSALQDSAGRSSVAGSEAA